MTITVSRAPALLLLSALNALCLFGQTNIAINSTVIQPSVKHLGINLGTLTNYDSGQIMKNLIVGNPGFEGQIWNSTIRCSSGTPASCTDEDVYSGWPANFWAGATYQVFYGTSAGRSGTVVSSTAAGNGQGVILNFGDSGVTPASGDYLIVRRTVPGGASGGWQTSTYGNGTVGDNLSDLPPNTAGTQTVVLSAPTASDSARIQASFDSTNTRSFLQLNGTYQLQFKAKGLAGSNQVLVQLARGATTSFINEAVNLSSSWNTYNLTFTAAEDGTAVSTVTLIFSTIYGADSFELDDVSLTQTNGDSSNGSVFRDPVVNALRTLQPGIIRFWDGNGQLGETLDNLLAPQFGRQRAGFSAFVNEADVITYGLHDFLVLCQTVGAEPWVVVPTTFSTTDAANLIEYLAGASTTAYGAKRAALGQTAPWTQVFTKIHLEFGNEAWNSTFQGGSIFYNQPYGMRAQVIFAAMQADASYTQSVASSFDFVLGGQAASPGYNLGVQNFCNNNTSFTIAPYTMNNVDSYGDMESLFGSTFAEPEALMSSSSSSSAEGLSPGEVYQNYQQNQQSYHPVPLSFYEVNMSTLSGSIPQDALNTYVSSLGAGLMVADTMLQGMQQFGIVNQNLFALPQYENKRTDGSTVYLWGSVIDMGVTDRKRPQFLALQLANQALSNGASMLQTVQTGDNPTWNESTMTNTVQFTGAHTIQSYAFRQGTSFSTILFNFSRSSALPVTFGGADAPAGTVLMQQLTSANVNDTNETSNVVNITSSTLTGFNAANGLSLPPYSMTVLTWSTSAQAPVISGVMATAITGNSATISWTTDQAASSQVNYGTTTSYGSSSSLNATLSNKHSVTISGLSQGMTYDFDATSVNSNGLSSTSANFTFSTPLPAPAISGISVSAITPASATILWTTDQPATSQVTFGTSSSYGVANINSALVTNHSMTLTGLTPGTAYSFSVTASNSAGTAATSSSLAFSTISAPVISNVAASNVTATSATITWSTDQPSTSQVLYGATTSYGASSAPNTALATSHSVTLTGLTPGTAYSFGVLSANAYSLSTTSANFTFSTGQKGPVISYTVSAGVTNTSATISWTTDVASTSQVEYGTTPAYGSTSALDSTPTTTHAVILTGLTLGTTYNYAVMSSNAGNAVSTSQNFTFTTAGGAATTNIAIGATPIQPSVKRLGINLGTLTNFDSGQMMKNLIVPNPGFEGQIWNSILVCAASTATSCIDQNTYSNWPAGFWNNASYQVISGAAIGRSGTVATSAAAGGGQGAVITFADTGTSPGTGAYIIVRKTVSGGASGGWQTNTSSGGTVTDNLGDLPPGTSGQQTVALSAPTDSDYASISTQFDTSSGRTFVQLNGTYQLQFKARALGGSNQLGVVLQRSGGIAFLNEAVVLNSGWNTYNLTFTAAENGSAIGGVSLAFSTVFGKDYIELDDVSLTNVSGDTSNATVFQDGVVNALRTAQPGILRYWGGNGQMGETLDNLLKPQFGRQRAGYSEFAASANQIGYGLHEFLALCQTVGAEPWFVLPSTFSTTDAANLIEYLASPSTTAYGAKRASLGQSAPWTQVFSQIHLEFGEQAWNASLAGGNITNAAAYGAQAQTIFAAMQSDPYYTVSGGNFDLVLGGQASAPADITAIQNLVSINNSFDIEPYTMNTVDSYSTNEALFGPTFAEPEALMSPSGTAEGATQGLVYQAYQALQQSTHPVPLSFSEINLSTLNGSITQQALNSYVSSLGAGLMVADTMLQGLAQFGVVNQNLYSLAQYSSTTANNLSAYLSGAVVDMGVTNLRRPQYLALELANQALSNGATMLQTTQSGANPTWDQPLMNSVYLNGAHLVQSYAFQNGSSMSAVIFNFSRTASLPVTFGGINAPAGTVQLQQLTSANPTDTNETSNVVQIASSTMTSFNGTTGLSLPAYSMTVLTWSTSTQAPVISGVSATGITGTSAMIHWKTDQPSNALVEYGTTAAYGSASPLNATLSTSHCITISGLTAGGSYNFAVVSANAAGTSSTSTNFTFNTSQAAPAISAVSVQVISGTTATITWTTDQAATSLVNYGTSSNYGLVVESNAMASSHSVTLTGLVSNAVYNFEVMSANSAGAVSTSANFTFNGGNPPVISNINATNITNSSATISWTTDQPANSVVNYGTSTTYNLAASGPSFVTAHSVVLTGLTAGTAYDFNIVSANSVGTYTTSANSTFVTTSGTPVISNVLATAVSSTSETITWTTDQPASSLVNFGATAAYGSASTLVSTLTTSHSVTLTGLTASTVYDFDVVSANAAGTSATSANATFTTQASSGTAPYVGYVAFWGVSNSGVTISWSTDLKSTTFVTYGTTAALGQTTPVQTSLSTSHGVVLSGLNSGTTYYFVAESTGANGATGSSTTYSFTTTGSAAVAAPVISAVLAGGVNSTSATITWTTDEASSSQVNYGTTSAYGSASTVNTALVTSHSVTLTGLTAGTTYNFDVVSANSAGGSAASANYTFTTAGTAAPPVISSIATSGVTGNSITVTWTTDQASSSLVNYGTTASYGSATALNSSLVTSHSVTLTGLTAGATYNFDVVSANGAGTAATSANATFATSSAGPAPAVGYVAFWGVNNTGVTISWSTDVNATTQVAYGTSGALGQLSALQTSMATNHGVVLAGLNPGTTYYFVAESTGANGVTGYSTTYSFTTTGTAASAAPVISGVTSTGLTSSSATVAWTTDQASSSQVNYGTTTAYGASSLVNTSLVTSHSLTLTGLTAGTTYNFDVVSANSSGTATTSTNYTFTTLAAGGTPPVITSVMTNSISGTSVTITWTTDQAASSQVSYGPTPAYGSASTLNTSLTTTHSVTLTGLTAGNTYDFEVISANASGISATSANASFTTAASTATPPYVGYVAYWGVSNTGATISWSTDVNSTTQLAYGTSNALGKLSPLQTTMSSSHGVVLSGLNPGTTYYFVAQSAGANGATGYSATYNFTTTGTATAAAPLISSVTASNVTSTAATITWTTDQASSAQVNYGTTTAYGLATAATSSFITSQSVALTGLTPSTTYSFDAVSANASGVSSTSANYTFTTGAAAGAPLISNVTATSISSTSATVSWTTDQAATSQVSYGLTSGYGSLSPLSSNLTTSHSVTLTGLAAGTTYDFEVESANASGASTTSSNSSFVTTATTTGAPPSISYVAFWGVNNNGVTISWSTDVASTTRVAYGTAAALGQLSPLQTALSQSHGVTLTGLNPGTTYYFVAQSTGANGSTGYSTTYSFTTSGSSLPAISGLTVIPQSGNTALISWTTSVSTYSYVQYGTAAGSYIRYSAQTGLTTAPACVLSYVPSGVNHYQVVSTDAYGNQIVSVDATFVEP